MPLPSSGAISLSQVNTELGASSTATRNMGATSTRELFEDASGQISLSQGYGKIETFRFTINTNQLKTNLRTLAVAAGWNQSARVVATVATDVYIYSDNPSSAALTINGLFPKGVELVNNGFIMGAGGDGGQYGGSSAGAGGGPAITLGVNATITSSNVYACIAGGGGGGGGGAYSGGGGGAGGGNGGAPQDYPAGYAGTPGPGGGPGLSGSNGTAGYWGPYNNVAGGGGGGGRVGKIVNEGGFVFNIVLAAGGAGGGQLISNAGGKGGQAGGGGGGMDAGGSATGGEGGGSNFAGGNGGYPLAGGGGGWSAAGGSAPFGSVPGGAGGKAIALNGFTATVNAPVGQGVIFGAVS